MSCFPSTINTKSTFMASPAPYPRSSRISPMSTFSLAVEKHSLSRTTWRIWREVKFRRSWGEWVLKITWFFFERRYRISLAVF